MPIAPGTAADSAEVKRLLEAASLPAADRRRTGAGPGPGPGAAAEALGRGSGIRQLYLLTTTADGFFAARGYDAADRAQAPEEIRAMPQFSGLCPAASAYLTRAL